MRELRRSTAGRWLKNLALGTAGAVILCATADSKEAGAVQTNAAACPEAEQRSIPLSLRCTPPSDYSSAEFRRYYAGPLTAGRLNIPAVDAPKSEWDKYDARAAAFLAPYLEQALREYRVDVDTTTIAGVHVAVVSPREGIAPTNRRRVLINLHGGAFYANRGLVFSQLESIPVAAIGRIKVVTLDYRQAPYHQYPAASEDVEAVYRHLLKEYPAAAIGIFGCSAGGALTAQAVAWLQSRGLPRPGAVGIFCSGPSAKWGPSRGDSQIWGSPPPPQTAEQKPHKLSPSEWYMATAASDDTRAYPNSSDEVVSQFPPTLFVSGTRDPLMSPALVAHAQWLRLNVDASLYIMEGAPHAAHVIAVGSREARDANTYIARWFLQHLASADERVSRTE
jgi:epsilon-lactone hydrolase